MAWGKSVTSSRQWVLPLFILAALPLFFVGGPDWVSSPLRRLAWSLGHILYFALLVVWIQAHWPLDKIRHWLCLGGIVILLSVGIEAIQSQVGRDASWQDGMRNLIGAGVGLFWRQPGRPLVWGARLVVTALLLWQLVPFGQVALDSWHRWQQFPVLSDFESRRDLNAWEGVLERVTEPVVQGDYSLAFQVGDATREQRYTGAGLKYLVGDWREYRWLAFSLYSEQVLAITLRINDRYHDRHSNRYEDRFNRPLALVPGWNHYRLSLEEVRTAPEQRDMNMAEIQRLLFFATGLSKKHTLYLDNLRLE